MHVLASAFYSKGSYFSTQLELINNPTQLIGEAVPFEGKFTAIT